MELKGVGFRFLLTLMINPRECPKENAKVVMKDSQFMMIEATQGYIC